MSDVNPLRMASKPTGRYRVGLLTSHPIQCQAPLFRALAAHPEIDLTVYFGSDHGVGGARDPQFGVTFAWDVPLVDGYAHQFLANVARRPDVNRYGGVDTPSIAARIRRGRFDAFIVFGWYLKSSWQAIRACWQTATPLVLRGVSYLAMPPRSLPVRAARQWRLRRLFRRCDAFLTTGEHNEAYYRHFGADPGRFVRTPHAVDNARFAAAAHRLRPQRAELRRRWRLPDDACVFLFSGKLIPKKRPMDAIAAIGSVPPSLEAALLVVGDGACRLRCEQVAGPLGRQRVRFAGFLNQSQMPEAYAAADVLVMPSGRGETWGLSVNEAMACGLPAIVSDRVGCAPDLVRPGRTGQIVPCGDIGALTDAMQAMAGDRQRTQRLGLEAKRLVATYSIADAVQGVADALRRVGGPRRDGANVYSDVA